jgi:hypothetical protein
MPSLMAEGELTSSLTQRALGQFLRQECGVAQCHAEQVFGPISTGLALPRLMVGSQAAKIT